MLHKPEEVRAFFAWSNDVLDRMVLRPLSHITLAWELTWDEEAQRYGEEDGSFAAILNQAFVDISQTYPPVRYHDNEDRLAEYVVSRLSWNIRKEGNRWVGENYDSVLEQGGFGDIDQIELLNAAAGRVHAALDRGQLHFDDMEESHQRMLGAILTIILYHRAESLQ